MNKIDLNGRCAVVTGGAQGFGRAITERFAASGAKVAIWDHDQPLAEKTAREVGSGTIETPSMLNRAAAAGPGGREMFVSRQPMGRLGTAEEIASLAVYLASDESAFTTGVAHIIDGGWTL